MIRLALLILVAACAVGCSELLLEEETPPRILVGEDGENNAVLCSDKIDNDGDGYIDCADPQCLVTGDPENDPDCLNSPCPGRVVCVDSENTDKLCSDGIDNNANGFVDCADAGCERNLAITVCGVREPEDNDAACSDGIDNDKNGFIDCQDFGCSRNDQVTVCCTPTTQGDENTDEMCVDGIDNDCNGFVDCRDFGCSQNAQVTVCAMTTSDASETDCSDGVDNDADGRIDCGDWDCLPPDGGTVSPDCQNISAEDSEAACADGNDNDRDGLIDCRDWSCWDGFPELCQQ